jgi:hypothetical protein
MQIVDPREEELPDVGWLTLEDAETGEQIEVNTSDRRVRTAMAERVRAIAQTRLKDFRRKRIDTVTLRTNEDYVVPLRAFFRNRERRMMLRA